MANNSYPKDNLGNAVRKGDMVLYKMPDPQLLFKVMDVLPAPIIQTESGAIMPTTGQVVLSAVIPLDYDGQKPILLGMFKVSLPEPENIVVPGSPELVGKPS